MKRALVVLVALVSVSLLGCGGAVVEAEPASSTELAAGAGSTVSQFATCTARCDGASPVSCSGTTCSATDNQGVTCNGVFTACAQPSDPCADLAECSSFSTGYCFQPGLRWDCCTGGTVSYCECTSAESWICA